MPIISYLSNIVDFEAKSFFSVDNPAVVLETVVREGAFEATTGER